MMVELFWRLHQRFLISTRKFHRYLLDAREAGLVRSFRPASFCSFLRRKQALVASVNF